MLKLNQVCKEYSYDKQTLPVVKNVSLEVKQGTFVALVGPSGCGKSTLLNMIGALDQPSSGQIYYNDLEISTCSENQKEQYRLEKLGTIFQNFNLIPHLSAQENIEVPMIIAGINRSKRRKKCKELLELVGLSDRMHHKPNQLSGGQKQRVAIARALALNPALLLADEPTGALDSQNSILILQLLKDIVKQKGTTIIMVTHSSEIAAEADHLITMFDGEIIQEEHASEGIITTHLNSKRKLNKMGFGEAIRNAMMNLFKKKWRTLLVCLGSSIGICGIALVVGLGMGIENKIKEEISPFLDPLVIKVSTKESEIAPVDEAQLEALARIPQVTSSYYVYELFAGLTYLEKTIETKIISSSKPREHIRDSDIDKLMYGHYPENRNEIVLPHYIATQFIPEGEDIQQLIGQEITLHVISTQLEDPTATTAIQMTISGIQIKGVLAALFNPLIEHEYAKELSMGLSQVPLSVVKETAVMVDTENDITEVTKSIEDMQLYAIKPNEIIKTITKYSRIAQSLLSFFAGISLVVSSIMIGIVLYTSVLERTKEIGILKALGARRKDVLRIFLTEAGSIGFISGTLGLVMAVSLGYIGNELFKHYVLKNTNVFHIFVFPLTLCVICISLSVLLSVCAGWIPARRASRLNPVDALRHE